MNKYFNSDIKENVFWINESQYDKIDNQYYSGDIDFKWWYIIYKIITDSKFRLHLRKLMLYAFRWEETIRGNDSVDIFLFKGNHCPEFFIIKKDAKDK